MIEKVGVIFVMVMKLWMCWLVKIIYFLFGRIVGVEFRLGDSLGLRRSFMNGLMGDDMFRGYLSFLVVLVMYLMW